MIDPKANVFFYESRDDIEKTTTKTSKLSDPQITAFLTESCVKLSGMLLAERLQKSLKPFRKKLVRSVTLSGRFNVRWLRQGCFINLVTWVLYSLPCPSQSVAFDPKWLCVERQKELRQQRAQLFSLLARTPECQFAAEWPKTTVRASVSNAYSCLVETIPTQYFLISWFLRDILIYFALLCITPQALWLRASSLLGGLHASRLSVSGPHLSKSWSSQLPQLPPHTSRHWALGHPRHDSFWSFIPFSTDGFILYEFLQKHVLCT